MVLEYLLISASLGALFGSLIVFIIWLIKKGKIKSEITSLQERLCLKERECIERKEQLQRYETIIEEKQVLLADENRQRVKVETQLENEQIFNKERRNILEDTMNKHFQNLASRIFEDKTQKFTEHNKNSLNGLLNPLREQIKNFEGKVSEIYDKESKERFSLTKEIEKLRDLNIRISDDAANLTNALRGQSKTLGDWGEFVLEKVLEMSGLTNGREYETQKFFRDKDGDGKRPDVIVHLPENRTIVIDSKVTLNSFTRYCSENDTEGKQKELARYFDAVRLHIKELSKKEYKNINGQDSLDYVLMFIPIEPAFMLAVSNMELFQFALDKNIIIVCPSTLIATLRTVKNIWKIEYQNRNAQEIADKAGKMYDKFVGFVEDLQNIGNAINKTKEVYDSSLKKLSTGQGNLVKKTKELENLGIRNAKKLDKELVERSND